MPDTDLSGNEAAPTFDAAIDALLASSPELQPTEPPTAEPSMEPTVEPEPPSLPDDLADELAEAEEDKPVEAEPVKVDVAPITPNSLDLNSSRGKRIYGGYKGWKAVTEKLGYEPSVDEVAQFHQAFTDRLAMETEFTSPEPQDTVNFIENLNQVSPEGLGRVASFLPDYLVRTNNIQGYIAVATPILNRLVNGLYEEGRVEANPEVKQRLVDAARILEVRLTGGRYRTDEDLAKPPDPLAARESEINSKLSRIEQFEKAQVNQRQESFIRETNTQIDTTLAGEVDKALDPLKQIYGKQPAVYDALRGNFLNTVRTQVQSSPEAWRAFNVRYSQALRTQTDSDRADLVGRFRAIATRVITANRAKFIRDATGAAVRANADRRTQLQQAAGRVAPASTISPVQRSITPLGNAKTLDEKMNEILGIM